MIRPKHYSWRYKSGWLIGTHEGDLQHNYERIRELLFEAVAERITWHKIGLVNVLVNVVRRDLND